MSFVTAAAIAPLAAHHAAGEFFGDGHRPAPDGDGYDLRDGLVLVRHIDVAVGGYPSGIRQ